MNESIYVARFKLIMPTYKNALLSTIKVIAGKSTVPIHYTLRTQSYILKSSRGYL